MATWNRSDPSERATADGKPESRRANQALRDYLLMGSARSLNKLLAMYVPDPNPPTKSHKSVSRWSVIYEWVSRSERFDELQQEKAQAEYDARRKEIMETGLALDHERVEVLKNLHAKLNGYLADEDLIWMKDAKSIRVGTSLQATGEGKYQQVGEYERLDLVSFNAPLIGKILETLEALAAETGGRVKKTENSGSIQLVQITSDDMATARKAAEEYEKALLGDGNTE